MTKVKQFDVQYQLTENPNVVRRVTDGTLIPDDHYLWRGYQEWLEDGNEALPADVPSADESSANAAAMRFLAYKEEADPLFFKYQRGEATKEDWLAKVNEIKERFPKP